MVDDLANNAHDGNGNPVGQTINALGFTKAYKTYEGLLITDTVLDVYTDLGRYGTAGYIINDASGDSVGIQFSINGTTYGDTITIKGTEIFNFDTWLQFKTIRLIHTNNINYRLVVR